MAARRCSLCAINWPTKAEYIDCPVCEEKTSRMYNADPLDEEEAASLRKHAEFDRYYERREAARSGETVDKDISKLLEEPPEFSP